MSRSRTSSIGDDSFSNYGGIDLTAGTSNIRNFMKNLLTRTDQMHNPDCKYYEGSSDKGTTNKSQHETATVSPSLSEGDEKIQHTHDTKESCECQRIPVVPVDKQHSNCSVPIKKINYFEDPGSLDESLSTLDTTLSCFDDSQDLSTMCDIYEEKIKQVKSILNDMHPEFENLEIDQRKYLPLKSDPNDQSCHRSESSNGEIETCEQQIRPKTRRTWWVEEQDSDQGY